MRPRCAPGGGATERSALACERRSAAPNAGRADRVRTPPAPSGSRVRRSGPFRSASIIITRWRCHPGKVPAGPCAARAQQLHWAPEHAQPRAARGARCRRALSRSRVQRRAAAARGTAAAAVRSAASLVRSRDPLLLVARPEHSGRAPRPDEPVDWRRGGSARLAGTGERSCCGGAKRRSRPSAISDGCATRSARQLASCAGASSAPRGA
jgi:hypothetical protein